MRRRARIAIIVVISAAAGCGGFLGFGADDEEPAPDGVGDAASTDESLNAEGASNTDTGPITADASRDASDGVDATDATTRADVLTLGDGRVCVPSAVCTVSVFDCCTDMEDVSAASCEGLCGVDICCF